MDLTLVLGAAAVVLAVAALLWAFTGNRQPRATVNLAGPMRSPSPQTGPATTDLRTATLDRGAGERLLDPLFESVGRFAKRYTPRGRIDAIEQRLLLAGTPNGWTVERVLAAKVVFAVLGLAAGLFVMTAKPGTSSLLLAVLLTVGGFFGPDLMLRHKAEERQQLVRRSLADTIDQLTVAVQAGLGLDAAIARVATTTKGPLAAELRRVVQDTRAGIRRSEALLAMSDRINLPELRQLVVALAQAEKLGLPVSQTLQVQAEELRVKRRQYAEEKAMKLPVKILFPMVICILPCIFIVVLGPGAINIYETLLKG